MIYSRTDTEKISLNHDTFWSGTPQKPRDKAVNHVFEKARSLSLDNQLEDAATALREGFLSPHSQSYLPLGNLYVQRKHAQSCRDYHRELDLETAMVTDVIARVRTDLPRKLLSPIRTIALFCDSVQQNLLTTFCLRTRR